MVEINLLPEELKKSRRAAPKIDVSSINLEKVPMLNIAVAAAVVLVVAQIAVFLFGLIFGAVYGSYENRYEAIAPARQEAEKLRSDISTMSKKITAIDELMVKRFSWAKKLNDLSDCVTPGIWLTHLEYDEKITEKPRATNSQRAREGSQAMEKVTEKYLVMTGAASSMGEEGTALIGRFIEKLKQNPSFYSDFSDIELGNIKREQANGQEIMTFKITCLFKNK
jgi:Tfp pilus assembly protein PilN